jgi:NADPH-dependent ferric siderophore reductase
MPSTTTTVPGLRRPRPRRPAMAWYRVRVIRVAQSSPNLRRITFIGEDLGALPFAGSDQRVQLLLPGHRLHAAGLSTVPDFLSWADEVRPTVHIYPIRNHRPASAEVDIDFTQHGDPGRAWRWAGSAEPGDEAALFGPAPEPAPPDGTRWPLVVGDESALPSYFWLAAESAARTIRGHLVVERGVDRTNIERAGYWRRGSGANDA